MLMVKEKFVINKKGKRVSVILDMDDYQKLLDEHEELESIRAYDKAKASGDEIIPFKQAVTEIELTRK